MGTVFLCTSLLVGICAWGFLLAGALTFNDPQNPSFRGFGWLLFLLDIFVSFGVFSMLFIIVRNWKRRPEARRLFCTGLICLAVAIGLGCLCFRMG